MHDKWLEMTLAEKLVQKKTYFTWSWMNIFVDEKVRLALLSLAEEVLQLRREKAKLHKQIAKLRGRKVSEPKMPSRLVRRWKDSLHDHD